MIDATHFIEDYSYSLEVDESRTKGNPIARLRFRWQTWTKDTDEPLESEWSQFKNEAILCASKHLVKQFEKFKKDDMVVKIFNEMNYKQKPMIITLDQAQIISELRKAEKKY